MATEQGSRSFYHVDNYSNQPPNMASRSTREMFPVRQFGHQGSGSIRGPPQKSHRKPCPVHSARRSRPPSVSRELRFFKPKFPSDHNLAGLSRQFQGMLTSKGDAHEIEKRADFTDELEFKNVEERGFSDEKCLAAEEQSAKMSELPRRRRSSSLPKSPRRLTTVDKTECEPQSTNSRQTQTKPMIILPPYQAPPPHNEPIAYEREETYEQAGPSPKPERYNESPSKIRPSAQFMNVPPQRRPEFMRIPPEFRPEFMNMPPQHEPEFMNIPPRNRPQYMNCPPQERHGYMNYPPQDRPEYMNFPPHERHEYMNVPPHGRHEYMNVPPHERHEYMNVPPHERHEYMNIPPHERHEYVNVPPHERREYMKVPPQDRPEYMNVPPHNRPEYINIPPQNRPEYIEIPPQEKHEYMNNFPQKRPESQFEKMPPQNEDFASCGKPGNERRGLSMDKNYKIPPEKYGNKDHVDDNGKEPTAYNFQSAEDEAGGDLENKREDFRDVCFDGKHENENVLDSRNKNVDLDFKDDHYRHFEGGNEQHYRVDPSNQPDYKNLEANNYSRSDRPFYKGEKNEDCRMNRQGHEYTDPRIHHESRYYSGNRNIDSRMYQQPPNLRGRDEDTYSQDFRKENVNSRSNPIDPRTQQPANREYKKEYPRHGPNNNIEKQNIDSRIENSYNLGVENDVKKSGQYHNYYENKNIDSRSRQKSNNREDNNEDRKMDYLEKKVVDPRVEQGYDNYSRDRNENSNIGQILNSKNLDSRSEKSYNHGDRNDESKMENEDSKNIQKNATHDEVSSHIDSKKFEDFQGKNNVTFKENERVANQQIISNNQETKNYAEFIHKINPSSQEVTYDISSPEKGSDEHVRDTSSGNKSMKPKMNVCLKLITNKKGELCVVRDTSCACCNHE